MYFCSSFFFSTTCLGNPDVLICGNCRECFSEISELLDHKRTYCKLRFACKCQQSNGNCASGAVTTPTTTTAAPAEPSSVSTSKEGIAGGPDTDIDLCGNLIVFAEVPSSSSSSPLTATASARLLCVVCKSVFQSPWDLMVHVQASHMINIYELGTSNNSTVSPASSDKEEKSPRESVKDTESTTTKVPNTAESSPSSVVSKNVNHSHESKEVSSD